MQLNNGAIFKGGTYSGNLGYSISELKELKSGRASVISSISLSNQTCKQSGLPTVQLVRPDARTVQNGAILTVHSPSKPSDRPTDT